MTIPTPLPDLAVGPDCVPGVAVLLDGRVVRLTAPNPSIMTGPDTNTYVVGEDEVLIIDPGPELEHHRDAVMAVVGGRPVRAVAVTHHHPDHAPGARSLADLVGAPVVGFGHAQFAVDVVAHEGTELSAGPLRLIAWYTPGHASDHLCFFEPVSGWLFTGDHLMQGSTVVIGPPDGDLTAYLDSVRRVRDDGRVKRLAPGHGQVLSPPGQAAGVVLEHRAQRARLVHEALVAHGPATAESLVSFAYPDVGPERTAIATSTCWAHLLALEDEGSARRTGGREDPLARFEAVATPSG